MRHARLFAACLTLLILALPAPLPAAEPAADILPFKATTTTLPNGLVVIVVPTGFPNIVSLQIPVLTGSRNEVEPGKSGFAHFFEHMMFRGTPTLPPDQYNEIITKAGAAQNAYTTDDYTNYHVTFPMYAKIEVNGRVVTAAIDDIEDSAGGSVRCMLAEIHLPGSAQPD